MPDGFAKYQSFYSRPAAILLEWHDGQTPAVAWLAIDSLRGSACGGGTRMRDKGTREEAIFLAKTMAVKFRACGPDIGGAKSVIRFDAASPREVKHGVLERWFRHIGPYLKACYGTGGDVGVDEVDEATRITQRVLGLSHVQEGIARGHNWNDGENPDAKVARLRHGVEALLTLPDLPGPRDGQWMVADVVTGLGVARSIEAYYKQRATPLAGQRVIIEGFGAVGAFTAYYLSKAGAILVSTSTRNPDGTIRVALDPQGLSIHKLIQSRDGTNLPRPGSTHGHPHEQVLDTASGDELLNVQADIYIPAAASHTTTAARIQVLRKAGIKVISCGANNPFAYEARKRSVAEWVADMLLLQREADKHFAILPDFIANCGMARAFHYLMKAGAQTDAAPIIADAAATIDQRVAELLRSHDQPTGLLDHAYEMFVP